MRRECHLILMFGLIILCSTLQGCGYSDVEEKAVAIEESSTETDKPSDETPTDTGSEENDAEKIRDGYYGFQADDGTRYSLGINIEGFQDYFMLSVLPVNGGGVVIEGSIKDNGDGTYIARVNNNNSDGLSDKCFMIQATEKGATVFSEEDAFNTIAGFYPYVGNDWEEFESIFDDGKESVEEYAETDAGIEGIEFVTDDDFGGKLIVGDNGSNYRFELSLYRLTNITGTAEENPDNSEMLDFTGTDASGNPIKGTIEQTETGCVLTITDSTWEYLKNGTQYTFIRNLDYLSGKYIYQGSDSCIMTEGDVELAKRNFDEDLPDGKTIEQMIINEIYAKHGYIFRNAGIQAFFEDKSWYHGTTDSMDKVYKELNDFEKQNIDFLQR